MRLFWARFKRWMASASSVALLFLVPLAALAIAALGKVQGPSEIHPGDVVLVISEGWIVIVAIVTFLLAAVIAIIETIGKYQRLTYEPTLAIKYWERLRGMKEERAKAASALSTYHDKLGDITGLRKELAPIDEILDELDAIGLYVKGQQMSPEIAHDFFYYWIRGYYEARAGEYIQQCRAEEPKLWEHISYLYIITSQVEHGFCSRSKKLDEKRVTAFLVEEGACASS